MDTRSLFNNFQRRNPDKIDYKDLSLNELNEAYHINIVKDYCVQRTNNNQGLTDKCIKSYNEVFSKFKN